LKWLDPALLATIKRQFEQAKVSQAHRKPTWEDPMKNPLDSLWGTIISGLVLTAILYYVVKSIPV
jgi:hypothetical protein